ncbi:hypothetical protein [Kitasatospora sp. NPDC048538]|uniref:hypothetical protein n=1 Tax=unclassified Kitasatospora TaxID=2633591 RepID=UPI0033C9ADF0
MSDSTPAAAAGDLAALVRRAPLGFRGTVTRVGGTSLAAVPPGADDARTAVVAVTEVLHAPNGFRRLAGSEVTVRLAADASPLAVGDTAAFFTRGLVYGEGLGVVELGRLPADAVQQHVSMAATTADEMPLSSVQRTIREEDLAAHAGQTDAVVVATVVGLEDVDRASHSEHAPHWWRAALDVSIVEAGDVAPGRITVLYPSSGDRRWLHVPKPAPGQEALWLLHATTGELAAEAPFQLLHPDDRQPVQRLAVLREGR